MDILKVNIPDADRKVLEYKKALAERDAMMHSANELDKELYNYINEILKHRSHPSILGIVNIVFWLIITIASLIWFIVGEPVAIYFFILFLVSYITGVLWYAYSMSQHKRKYKNFNAMQLNGAPAIIIKMGQTDYIGSLRNWFKQAK